MARYGWSEHGASALQPERRLEQLLDYLARVRQRARKNGSSPEVLRVREEVQELCAATAASERRLFSLTVPTGGGKTLAAMLVVFKHASKLGEAPAQTLFEKVAAEKKSEVQIPRKFEDYDLRLPSADQVPNGVEVMFPF